MPDGEVGNKVEQPEAVKRQLRAGVGHTVRGYEFIVTEVAGVKLTERELQMVIGIVRGKSNQEMADHLHLSYNTVKMHIHRLFRKVQVTERASLVVWAYTTGLLDELPPEPLNWSGKPLTSREALMIRLVMRGLTNAAAAHSVYLSEDTIKTHIQKTLRKVGAKNRSHLVALAWQHKLIPRSEWENV